MLDDDYAHTHHDDMAQSQSQSPEEAYEDGDGRIRRDDKAPLLLPVAGVDGTAAAALLRNLDMVKQMLWRKERKELEKVTMKL